MWFVYLLTCSDGTLYCGITNDLERRLMQHNAGTGAKYVRARRPAVISYTEAASDRSAASKREAAIKKMSRSEKLRLISLRP